MTAEAQTPLAPAASASDTGAPARLAGKLAQVSGAINQVARDGHNSHFGYSYATAEAILDAVRGPLAAAGVTLTAEISGPLVEVRELSKQRQLVRLPVRFTFRDGTEELGVDWIGEAADAESSGVAKAMTNALRTFLRAQFLIPQAGEENSAGGGQRRGRMEHRAPEALSPATYRKLVDTYQKAGRPIDLLEQWLNEQGVAAAEDTVARILTITETQGNAALEFLLGLGEPVPPATAEATT